MHKKLINMRKFIFTSLLIGVGLLFSSTANAQDGGILINNKTIEECLIGKWAVIRVRPNDKAVSLRGFTMKGTGYGEIESVAENNSTKKVLGRIFALNNNSIVFTDNEGHRIIYKVEYLTKTMIQLTDGTNSVDIAKQ
jgi:hypothetical protein